MHAIIMYHDFELCYSKILKLFSTRKRIIWAYRLNSSQLGKLKKKIRVFLHRIIATNDFLYKLQIIESNLCTFCGDEIETLEHVFYECDIIKRFWTRVVEWINEKVDSDVSVTRENIFLGYNVNNPPMAINYIILLGKQFIYKCKLHKTIPKFFIFVRNINDFIKIEYIIASNRNKMTSHFAKWDGFMWILMLSYIVFCLPLGHGWLIPLMYCPTKIVFVLADK